MHTTTRKILCGGASFSLVAALAALAGPGQGIGVGSWVFRPYVNANATYDSNVFKTRNDEIADTFLEPEVGLRLSSSTETNRLSLRANAYHSWREYLQESEANFRNFGENVTVLYGNPERFSVEGIQSFRQVEDNDRHASDIESSGLSESMIQDIHTLSARRDVAQMGVGVSRWFTEKSDLAVLYRYSSVAYEDETTFLDLEGHAAQLEAAYFVTEKSAAYLSLHQGLQQQERTSDDATVTTLRLGARTRGSEKVSYKIGAGVERYVRPDAIDDSASRSFNFDGSIEWYVSEKVTVRVGGYNGTQLSSFYEGNGLTYLSGWAGAGYRWTRSLTFSVRAIYREDDYLDRVAYEDGLIDRKDQRFECHGRLDYNAPSDCLKLYLEASYDFVDSNIDPVDYDDTRLIAGAEFIY